MRRTATSGAPRLPSTFVPRLRLWERLDRATSGPVTVLVAPAGAGKSLGVSGWLRDRGDTEAHWVQGDATWEAGRLERELRRSLSPTGHARRPGLVVIDDAHLLPASALRLLDDRLNHAPETIRLLLLGRWDLPLTRLVPELLGHLTTLRGDVLHMDDDEVAALVAAHVGAADPVVVDAIASRANGWCAAVVLTAHAVATAPDPVAAALGYARGDTQMADRVANEVFAALQPRDRHVLLCTAGEEEVTATAAVQLSHEPRAPETLARLEQTGLLVTRVDDPAGSAVMGGDPDPSYRIHPLLAEVIRRRLVSGGVDVARARATVARAVRLDLARGDSERAFDRLVGVHDIALATDVLAAEGALMVMRGDGAGIATFARRHPEVVEERPDTWFAIALDRWCADDVEASRHWLDRVLARGADDRPDSPAVACALLMRARLGLGSLPDAVDRAQRTADAAQRAGTDEVDVLPLLLTELGNSQNWTGDLVRAEVNLTAAIEMCRQRTLPALAAAAASHLALTAYMGGRERAAVEVATEALGLVGAALPRRVRFTGTRAALVLLLGGLVDLPWPTDPIEAPEAPAPLHSADLCARFWLRMRNARLRLLAGSAADAERVLTTPLEIPAAEEQLPHHLHVAILVERAFLAALCADRLLVRELHERLVSLGVPGEAALAEGLGADLSGDRRAAAAAFGVAAAGCSYPQPPSRILALTCLAQLRDALGDHAGALETLRDAAQATEVRRNAVAFLGWSRQGAPLGPLLTELERLGGPAARRWVRELAVAATAQPDVTAVFASRTPAPRERPAGAELLVPPSLSPREREVLRELARGATYADIAADLFVTENTVKTHVSSLYGKLAVSRRSEALAVARSLQLL